MAYSGYSRGHFYDVRNLPPYHASYYGYHPMEMDYHRSRPAKLNQRVLNRRFKKVTIQLSDSKGLQLAVQATKSKQPFLVFSQSDSAENKTDSVSVPESLVVPLVQQLHKISKFRPNASGSLPTEKGLVFEDTVFKVQIADQSEPDCPSDAKQYAIKLLAETRAKDPQERRELSAVYIPLESGHLTKVKEALNDVLVTSVESPLYHTKSHQGADGSKFYLDLIKENEAHYLKISQVTRDFRSILHIPADDLEAFKTLLESSLKAMKGQEEQKGKKRRSRPSRRRNKRSDAKASQSSDAEDKENARSPKAESDESSAEFEHADKPHAKEEKVETDQDKENEEKNKENEEKNKENEEKNEEKNKETEEKNEEKNKENESEKPTEEPAGEQQQQQEEQQQQEQQQQEQQQGEQQQQQEQQQQ